MFDRSIRLIKTLCYYLFWGYVVLFLSACFFAFFVFLAISC